MKTIYLDVKTWKIHTVFKLSLQTQQRELYDKQLNKIMDFLNLTNNNRCIGNILPALKELKESHCELANWQEQIETEHYSKAQSVIETFSSKQNSVNWNVVLCKLYIMIIYYYSVYESMVLCKLKYTSFFANTKVWII